jgi:tryptophanase
MMVDGTDCHDITEIFLKVALNTINHQPSSINKHERKYYEISGNFDIFLLILPE